MGRVGRQTRSELRQLPRMLGKLLGGLTAVIGFTTAVWIVTRKPDASSGDVLLPLLLGGAGVAFFLLSHKSRVRRSAAAEETQPADNARMNLAAWALLLLCAGVFLAFSFLLAR